MTITFNVQESFIMYAFRYTLGRKSYAVSEVAIFLIKNWEKLSPHTQIQIQKEIKEAIDKNLAGMDCDVNQWKKILELEK